MIPVHTNECYTSSDSSTDCLSGHVLANPEGGGGEEKKKNKETVIGRLGKIQHVNVPFTLPGLN